LYSPPRRLRNMWSNDHGHFGVTITFQDISVEVRKRAKSNESFSLLSSVSGMINAGTLTALMGPSGSGKTTLVDVITKRKNTGQLTGVVLYDGEEPQESYIRERVAYVQQDDALIPNLTVEETFFYNYDLTMGKRRLRGGERMKVVQSMLAELSLESCRDLSIGSGFRRGISGGQRKRVAIGISLLGNPGVLFMDEPTSGLDSFHAYEIMSLVKFVVVNKGLTVVSTIHAPSSSIFELFDTLMILVDGNMVFCGQADFALNIFTSYVQSISVMDGDEDLKMRRREMLMSTTQHRGDSSPADWLTSVVVLASRFHLSKELVDYYHNTVEYSNIIAELKNFSGDSSQASNQTGKGSVMRNHASCNTHAAGDTMKARRGNWIYLATWTVLEKCGLYCSFLIMRHRIKADYRMPNFVIPRVFEKAIFAVIILSLYWGVGKPLNDYSDASAQELLAKPMQINTALFMWGLLPAFSSVSVIPSIINERHVFYSETKSGYYNAGAYLIAKCIEECILAFFSSIVLALCVWFALFLSGSWLLFWLVYFVTTLVGIVLAYLCAAVAPNTEYAIIMCAGINIVLLFFVGLLIRWQDIPSYWKWIVYVNHLHYSWSALVKNQFSLEDTATRLGVPVLKYFSLDNSLSSWDYLGYEVIFVVVYFFAGVLALRWINYGRR
jgi:ATP-binding cassette, subfamily G (WHITE), member 2